VRKEEERENQPTCGKPWRSEHCGSTIAITRNGECVVRGVVRLGERYTRVECPVCHRKCTWYCNSRVT